MPFLGSLKQRDRQPEIMDEPGLDRSRHYGALCGLERINFWSGSAGILWPPLAGLARTLARPLRVLDVATGAGDVPIRLWQKAKRAGIAIEIEGCDVNAAAVEYAARRASDGNADVRFFVANALSGMLPDHFDAVISSLFLHHLKEPQAIELLRRMGKTAARMVLVNDLVRSRLGYVLAYVGGRVLTRCEVVHADGPRSVAAAFTVDEARRLAAQAGLDGATVAPRWPCRYLLSWSRAV
jgi:SAM-dependent methyltransferase